MDWSWRANVRETQKQFPIDQDSYFRWQTELSQDTGDMFTQPDTRDKIHLREGIPCKLRLQS